MNDNSLLSNINNFVHPFNSYKLVETTYTNTGKITINVTRLYSEEEIKAINDKIDELYPSLVSSNKSTTENIKRIHDYIINHVKYDTAYVEGNSTHKANTAYGALFEGYSVCSGYTDLMSIFLNKMGISNYKISNDKHVWNLVYLDGEWLHLDLTFDDPISSTGVNHLIHDYFLINTDKLKQLDQGENNNAHVFNEEIYSK
jgi:transglutaminase/protease-like cytokinesis protein 3